MAEQQVEGEVEQEVETDENKPAYKAPAKKTVEDILQADKDDESLQKYKQTLLGATDKIEKWWPDKPDVILRKMSIVVEGRPDEEIDLQDEAQLKNVKFNVKEGVEYCTKVTFNVQSQICSGLKLRNEIKRLTFSDTETWMVGSYRPNQTKDEIHTFTSKKENFPSGMLARGKYKVISTFLDDDETVHCKWEWSFEIKKDWKD